MSPIRFLAIATTAVVTNALINTIIISFLRVIFFIAHSFVHLEYLLNLDGADQFQAGKEDSNYIIYKNSGQVLLNVPIGIFRVLDEPSSQMKWLTTKKQQ